MSGTIHINVDTPTYYYSSSVKFKGDTYLDSRSLVEAFFNDWDYAITSFKCGDWNEFWNTYVSTDVETREENTKHFVAIYDAMWESNYKISPDILLAKAIHYIEPALKEIPCFIDSELSLWDREQIKSFFKRKLHSGYVSFLMCIDLRDRWDQEYDKEKMSILYACQMLKEKLFSLYGYVGAENLFLEYVSCFEEPDKGYQSERINAYQSVSNRLYRGNKFIYKGQVCTSLVEFGALWKTDCETWSIKEWDEFIAMLYDEKEDSISFRQWLYQINEQPLYGQLEEWKKESQKCEWYTWETKKSSAQIALPKYEWTLFEPYYHQKVKHSNIRFNLLIEAHRKEVKKLSTWIEEQSKRKQAEELRNLYSNMYQYLAEAISSLPKYETISLRTELDTLIETWKTWEEENQRDYKDKKLLADALSKNDVLSLWNHEFMSTPWKYGKKLNNRQYLALLSCVPVEEIYKNEFEPFLQLIEAGGMGCSPKEVQSYIEAIFDYIYMPLVEVSERPDESIRVSINKVLEYYFRLLQRLSKKLPENIELSDILSKESYKRAILKNEQIRKITFESSSSKLVDDTLMRKFYRQHVTTLCLYHKHINWVEFEKNSEKYQKWSDEILKMQDIKNEWLEHSNAFRKIVEEWKHYFCENYNKKSIDEIYRIKEEKSNVAKEHLRVVEQKEKEWHKRAIVVNELCSIIQKEWAQYVEAWEKKYGGKIEKMKRKELKVAKRKLFFEKVKYFIFNSLCS